MTRDTAWRILNTHIKNPILLNHSLFTEAVMRILSPRFDGDIDTWGITGLLHDADYEKSKDHPEHHGMLLSSLEPNTIPSIIEHAIQAHNYQETGVMPINHLDWAIVCCDELVGIISELATKQPDKKISSINTQFILQKIAEKGFAKGAKKEKILLCVEKLGIPLPEFVDITLKAMQGVAPSLGL